MIKNLNYLIIYRLKKLFLKNCYCKILCYIRKYLLNLINLYDICNNILDYNYTLDFINQMNPTSLRIYCGARSRTL